MKTADLANNAVTAAKIKDADVKAAEIAANAVGSSEIATDAVGAAEIAGVTKLLFAVCNPDDFAGLQIGPGARITPECTIAWGFE